MRSIPDMCHTSPSEANFVLCKPEKENSPTHFPLEVGRGTCLDQKAIKCQTQLIDVSVEHHRGQLTIEKSKYVSLEIQ